MSWFDSAKGRFKDYFVAEPIECPRGWGSVTFQPSVSFFIPVSFGVGMVCPIGGVASCTACRARFNPDDVEGLRERLNKLDELRLDDTLTEAETELRRHRIIDLREETQQSREERFGVIAWTVGPIGLVLGVAGGALAWAFHPGFLAIAIIGALGFALGLGFLYLSVARKDPS